jgi:polar amino acid transport system substrate-binding protein
MPRIDLLGASQFIHGYCLFLALSLSPVTLAQRLDFFISYPQSPPILYKDELTGRFKGIIPDIFNTMPEQDSVRINYIQYTRIRGEEALYNRDVDASILTKEWASAPEKLVFTVPIFHHRDFLYSNDPIPSSKNLDEIIAGKNICTRRGYIYPQLQHYFNHDVANQVVISTEDAELKMLLLERCQFAAVNEFIADWLISTNRWQGKIYRAPKPLNSIGFTLAFSPEWQAFVDKLNRHIQHIEQSGELAQIIHRNRFLTTETKQ